MACGKAVALHLVEEINHRVVNEYAEAIASLNIVASRSDDDRVGRALALAIDRLHDHAEAHRALMPPRVPADENLADYVGRICSSFSRATLAARGLGLLLRIADVMLPADRCWRIGLVVAELIRNAARHGRFDADGHIAVHIAAQAGDVVCFVEDNGGPVGPVAPGRGQALIRSLVADLGGMVEWSFTAKGCAAIARVPIDVPLLDAGDGKDRHDRIADTIVQ